MAAVIDFDETFQALTGRTPYSWQRRLYATLLAGRVPDALDLPTGLGKTSVLTIWLLARAAGAPVPRRLIYVVDRRAVVDQASAEAESISRRLAEGTAAMVRLRKALGLEADDLPVSTLRGQLTDNKAWLQRPEGVAIVVGTVDMVGSRLLFSGYGVSRRMRSVHAALIGHDALIVLDEAHLVLPFEAMLKAAADMAARFHRRAPLPVEPFRLVSLSATGRAAAGERFSLIETDRADAAVNTRLHAVKQLRLHAPVPVEALAETMAGFAFHRAGSDAAVVVFCNSRRIAQSVSRQLQAMVKKLPDKSRRVELLVGERRVHERTALAHGAIFARFSPDRHREGADVPELLGPAFLVATSAGEVGVDLDADHMVCDLVSWERMVQRLGRVNRRSSPGTALVDVCPAKQKQDKDTEEDVSDLDRLTKPFQSAAWPADDGGRRDASPSALLRLRDDADFKALAEKATSQSPLHPLLTLAHVQAWAMTSLERHPGRALVAPWLRGWVENVPECRVVWRKYIPVRRGTAQGQETTQGRLAVDAAFLQSCSPHLSEMLEAPVWRVAEVLKERAKALHKTDGGDAQRRPVCVIVLDTDGQLTDSFDVERLFDLKPDKLALRLAGRTLIVDQRFGGLDDDGLLDGKAESAPRTLDDGGHWTPTLDAIGFRVREGTREEADADPTWRTQATWTEQEDAETPDLVVDVRRALRSDEGDPAFARWAQRLGEHHAWAGRHAASIAAAVGLCDDAATMLRLAAEVHDEGKRRPEWQQALGMRADRGDAWAKSGRRSVADALAFGQADGRANPLLMAGYRHEFGSVRDADVAAERLPQAWRDIFLHLIAAHHGHARPTINAYDPAQPPSVSSALSQQVALRQTRLESHWGPWGLAWWETMLRAADWHASAQLNGTSSAEVDHG